MDLASRYDGAATLQDVLAVVTLYGVSPAEAVSVRSLGDELERAGTPMDLLLYDNSPKPAPELECQPAGWHARYVHDGSNPGVGAAYNAGAELAEGLGKRWLLLLDQDTAFPPGALGAYAEAVARHPACELFAPVLVSGGAACSPCRVVHGRGRPAPAAALEPGLRPLGDLHVLNSGLLVRTDLFRRAGGYDPAVRLDFSDFAFLHKAAQETDALCVVGARLQHDLSSGETDPGRLLQRFATYCEGARAYARLTGDALVYATVAARALRLSWRTRSVAPLRVAVSSLQPAPSV